MNKNFMLAVSAILFITIGASAQSALPKGQNQINFGVGFSGKGIPVYFGFDHAIHNNVTLGAELNYRGYEENYRNDNYKHNVLGVAGNINYHFNTLFSIPSNWDLYAGANVGFNVYNSPDNYDGDDVSGLGLGLQVGGRYFFTNKTGINLEFGGGNAFSGGKLGLTIKL
jgi:hypothetical protein